MKYSYLNISDLCQYMILYEHKPDIWIFHNRTLIKSGFVPLVTKFTIVAKFVTNRGKWKRLTVCRSGPNVHFSEFITILNCMVVSLPFCALVSERPYILYAVLYYYQIIIWWGSCELIHYLLQYFIILDVTYRLQSCGQFLVLPLSLEEFCFLISCSFFIELLWIFLTVVDISHSFLIGCIAFIN